MLSRIGNNLFWLGRYLERSEHLARYAKVQLISALDAPFENAKELHLASVLNMTGTYPAYLKRHETLDETSVLEFMALDEENLASIASTVNSARENAKSARALLSVELWEEINKYYHNITGYGKARLAQEGAYEFCYKVETTTMMIKGYIENSLPRNEVWLFISLGFHLERAAQLARIMRSKLFDISQTTGDVSEAAAEYYHVVSMLKSAESFDMSKRHYGKVPNRAQALEFLILNQSFPKSMIFNLHLVRQGIKRIVLPEDLDKKGTVSFHAGKLNQCYRYLTVEEIQDDAQTFLDETLTKIYQIAAMLEDKYLSY